MLHRHYTIHKDGEDINVRKIYKLDDETEKHWYNVSSSSIGRLIKASLNLETVDLDIWEWNYE